MEGRMKRRLAIGATGLAVLGGAGVAYGVTQGGGNDRQAFLNDVAKRLNVSPDQLNKALTGAFEDRLDAAVKAGRLTQAEADAIKRKVEQHGGVPLLGVPGPGPRFFDHGPGGPIKGGLDAAARYLGLSDAQLLDRLRSGKSLADVARGENKSVDGLKSAIRASVKADLDRAVKDKRLTQDQENRILSGLDSRLDQLVNRRGCGPGRELRRPGALGARRGSFHLRVAPGSAVPPPPGLPIV